MSNSRSTGELAEEIVAKKYAKSRRWKILARNYSKPWGEIDIIARKKKKIIFIEVKALNKTNTKHFKPEDHFTPDKQERIIKTCASYLQENGYPEDTDYRIDLAAVEVDYIARNARLRYYKNAIAH